MRGNAAYVYVVTADDTADRRVRQSLRIRFRRLQIYAYDNRTASAFDSAVTGRPLVVIVDGAHDDSDLERRVLLELADQPHLHVLTLNPHDGLPTLTVGDYVGRNDYFAVTYDHHETGRMVTGVPSGTAWRQHAAVESAESDISLEDALGCLLLMRAAAVIGADAVVSERLRMLSAEWRQQFAEIGWRSSAEALALAALLGRFRGDYRWRRMDARSTEYFPRHRYFAVASRQLLPASWRFIGACEQHFHATHNSLPATLATTVLDRVAQVLAIRDELLTVEQRDVTDDSAFDIRRHLDTLLWAWSAAFDTSARAAHIAYGRPSKALRGASWRKEAWLDQLGNPALVQLVGRGTVGRALLDIAFGLRNMIHGEGLSDKRYTVIGGHPALMSFGAATKRSHLFPEALQTVANAVRVPPDLYRDVLAAPLALLGGDAAWGVDATWESNVSVEPAALCERLLPNALRLLDALMTQTAVERLAGVESSGVDGSPPAGVDALAAAALPRWKALLGVAEIEDVLRVTARAPGSGGGG